MSETRSRPIKQFEVIVAYGPYRKGDRIQPTGLYRGELIRRGLIREVTDDVPAVREVIDLANRMQPLAGMEEQAPPLITRARRSR